MNWFQRFLTGRFFAFLSVFVILFCIISLLLLDVNHPLFIFSLVFGVAVFLMQQYRKKLLKRK